MPNRQATIHSRINFHALQTMLLVFMLGLAACSPTWVDQPVTASPLPAVSSTTVSQTPTSSTPVLSTALPASTATPIPTPTPDCDLQQGQVEEVALDTTYMYEPFKFRVYLPPCYAREVDQHYPVLYLFHGLFFSDDQWTRIGVVEVVNRLVITGEIAPFIIVMPYDPNQREPGSTTFDEVFMEDLLPYIDENYRTQPDPEFRAVGGLSRGAGWALHFGLKNPDLFGMIGAHSPIIFWEDSTKIGDLLNAIPRSRLPCIYVDIGDSDPNPDSAILLETLLKDRNIPYEYHVSPGYHTEQYWKSQVENYMRWYAAGW
jgi:enterochelin esterase-like enzyme